MCSKCQAYLGKNAIDIPHPPLNCPLMLSAYCSVCCSYGHFTEACPDEEVLQHREVEFVEQLVPYQLLQRYKIKSKTPIASSIVEQKKPKHEPVLEIEESDKTIRQVLMNYGMPISGKMKENRRVLKQVAEDMGRKLVYLKPT
jgi:hypothetical protein